MLKANNNNNNYNYDKIFVSFMVLKIIFHHIDQQKIKQ